MGTSPLVFAIDFGTTNSLLAAAEPGRVHPPIPLDPGEEGSGWDATLFRSILYFPNANLCHYGQSAIREYRANDLQGRFLRSMKKHLPVRSFVGTWIETRPMNLEDLIGLFLREMRLRGSAHFGRDVDVAVLGRPARFSMDDSQDAFAQYRLERAAKIAGFKHVEFCPEPVAAAMGFRDRLTEPKTVLVGDFGGGTSDFTVMRLGPGEYRDSDVLAVGGVPVAGDAFDGSIMRHRVAPWFGSNVSYQVPFGSNVLTMPRHLMEKLCSPADLTALGRRDTVEFFRNVRKWSLGPDDRDNIDRLFTLIEDQLGFSVFEEIERVKRELSTRPRETFRFDYPGVGIEQQVLRRDFEEFSRAQLDPILSALDDTLSAAGLLADQIDLVCCTGGTARLPALRTELVRRFGEERIIEHRRYHGVVEGLAERARELVRQS